MGIKENNLIVCLSVSKWLRRVQDKDISDEIIRNRNLPAKAVSSTRKLFPQDPPILKKLENQAVKIREVHDRYTLKWMPHAEILPVKLYSLYDTNLTDETDNLLRMVEYELVPNYWDLVTEAENLLNGTFNIKNYPTDVRTKYGVTRHVMPVTNANDFRLDDEQSVDMTQLTASAESSFSDAVHNAMADLYIKLADATSEIAEKLIADNSGIRQKSIIKFKEMLDMTGFLNIDNNPHLTEMQELISTELEGWNAADLNQYPQVKAHLGNRLRMLARDLRGEEVNA